MLGIAKAAMPAAQLFGRHVSIIGIGAPERGANKEIVSELNMTTDVTTDVASIRILELSGSELAANQQSADAEVIPLGRAAVVEDHADVLILGGSAFSGMAKRVQLHLPVPVICPISYAVKFAEAAVLMGWRKPRSGIFSAPGKKPISGVSPELAAFFLG